MSIVDIILAHRCGPLEWVAAPRPSDEKTYFVRLRNDEKLTHLDNTSHLINKIILGKDYEWAKINYEK